MANPKHDYDSDEFYALMQRAASVCAYDKDVALILDIDVETFTSMKNGNYIGWTDKQNERRSKKILKVLARARSQANMKAWDCVMKLGFGATKSRSRSIRGAGLRCHCKGKNKDCPDCRGTGWMMADNEDAGVIVQETETETPPSLQALSLWLHHHDPNYRVISRGGEVADEDVDYSSDGLDIDAWIKKENELHQDGPENPQEPTADDKDILP
ncbi:MAG: hypothetical protein LIP02_03970 [Bacteroidales bacterium]|nr:hypothetical protein [Bacteroidales bacterium]